jgi:DNA-binding transcriptional ArsR family regulator
MKLLALVLAIGFCLLAGAPLSAVIQPVERRAACCMAEEQAMQGRMSCHGPGGVQACSCKTHASSASAAVPSCGGACSMPVVLPGQQTGILLRIKRYAVRGYRRVTGKNILEHDTRREIYERIVALPGVDIRTLTRLTGLNENTLRYHLEKIEAGAKIRVTTTGGICHYFENHGKYSDDEQILFSRLFTSGSSRILHLVSTHPGLTRGELAGHLGVAGPTVTRSISHLIDDGLILSMREGRYTRYFPGWETKNAEMPHVYLSVE